jgi:hypothetical protein
MVDHLLEGVCRRSDSIGKVELQIPDQAVSSPLFLRRDGAASGTMVQPGSLLPGVSEGTILLPLIRRSEVRQ